MIRNALQRFMYGRYGSDQLTRFLPIAYLVLFGLYFVTGFDLFYLLCSVLIFVVLFRMLSRNGGKRYAENAKYMAFMNRCRTEAQQAKVRRANRKEFKYFRCPQCRVIIRLKRGTGERMVHCPKCHHEFQQKA